MNHTLRHRRNNKAESNNNNNNIAKRQCWTYVHSLYASSEEYSTVQYTESSRRLAVDDDFLFFSFLFCKVENAISVGLDEAVRRLGKATAHSLQYTTVQSCTIIYCIITRFLF